MAEHMVVTVCTRGRPSMLSSCLHSLLPQLSRSAVQTSLVVVENDTIHKAKHTVAHLAALYPSIHVEYRLQPQIGIPHARNMAVDTALELGADWVFFVDDDEEAEDGWFAAYLEAMRTWRADIFRGPVEYVYPPNQPEWLKMKAYDGGATGSRVKTAITNNLAVNARIFSDQGFGLRFDTRLRFSGGSDVALSRLATASGAIIRWVREARVKEHQHGERLTSAWLRSRVERTAATDLVLLTEHHGAAAGLRLVMARSPRLTLQAVLRFMATLLFTARENRASQATHFAGLKLARAKGYIRGALGALPQPYAARSVEYRSTAQDHAR